MIKKTKLLLSMILILVTLFFCALPVEKVHAEELGEVQTEAALLVIGDTDVVAYEKNADVKMAPASLTKIMTALLIVEAVEEGQYDYDTQVTVTKSAIKDIHWDASRLDNPIVEGEVMTVEDYLKAILLRSDAQSCNVMAEKTSGTVAAFVNKMNEEAKRLGCENTHFADTYGYCGMSDNHYSTARDIYKISKEAMKYEKFAEIVAMGKTTIPQTNKSYERTLYTTNWLIDMTAVYNRYGHTAYTNTTYDKCIGIKTGMTDEAGNCLSAAAVDNDLRVFSIVLGAKDIVNEDTSNTRLSFSETKRMFEWAFANYKAVTAFKKDIILGSMTFKNGQDEAVINVGAEDTFISGIRNDLEETKVTYKLEQTVTEGAPEAGDVVGTVTAYYGDVCIGSSNLIALESASGLLDEVAKEREAKELSPKITLAIIIIIVIAGVVTGKVYINYLRRKKLAQRRARRRAMMGDDYVRRTETEIDFVKYKNRNNKRRR